MPLGLNIVLDLFRRNFMLARTALLTAISNLKQNRLGGSAPRLREAMTGLSLGTRPIVNDANENDLFPTGKTNTVWRCGTVSIPTVCSDGRSEDRLQDHPFHFSAALSFLVENPTF